MSLSTAVAIRARGIDMFRSTEHFLSFSSVLLILSPLTRQLYIATHIILKSLDIVSYTLILSRKIRVIVLRALKVASQRGEKITGRRIS